MPTNSVIDPALKVAQYYAAAIAALPLAVIGYAVGKVFCTLIDAVAKNPSARDKVFMIGILGAALAEAVGLFALLVVILILYT